MRIDSAALPFVLVALAPSALAAGFQAWPWAVALLVLPVAVALFFRDPDRTVPADPALVLSPADGRVMHAGPARPGEAPDGAWLQVTIFLSVLDVHINRTPAPGRVRKVRFVPGTFRAAFRHDAWQNEHSEVWLDSPGGPVVFRQVVGLLARRVVCRVAEGDVLEAGQRIGLMKFGSRMDVFLPLNTATVSIQTGQVVRGGETVIARRRAEEKR